MLCSVVFAMASCLSVCLSVTLRYCDHIGYNSLKIISWLISLAFLLSADFNITDLRTPKAGPALGMFEVFGRTGPQNLGGGGAILDPIKITLPV